MVSSFAKDTRIDSCTLADKFSQLIDNFTKPYTMAQQQQQQQQDNNGEDRLHSESDDEDVEVLEAAAVAAAAAAAAHVAVAAVAGASDDDSDDGDAAAEAGGAGAGHGGYGAGENLAAAAAQIAAAAVAAAAGQAAAVFGGHGRKLVHIWRVKNGWDTLEGWVQHVPHFQGVTWRVIRQKDGLRRWVVSIPRALYQLVLADILDLGRAHHWLVRKHTPWLARHSKRLIHDEYADADSEAAASIASTEMSSDINSASTHSMRVRAQAMANGLEEGAATVPFMTYNINGLATKKSQLEARCIQQKLQVVALQETNHRRAHWRLRMRGYQVIEACARLGAVGARGVALMVRSGLTAYKVGRDSDNWVFARVLGGPLPQPWIFGSVYIPASIGGAAKTAMLVELGQEVRRILHKYPGPLVVMGDFNLKPGALMRKTRLWPQQLQMGRARPAGSDLSWGGHQVGRRRSTLDYILGNEVARQQLCRVHVDRMWDLSDHWPVRGTVHIAANQAQVVHDSRMVRAKYKPDVLKVKAGQFLGHNRFAALAPQDSSSDEDSGGEEDEAEDEHEAEVGEQHEDEHEAEVGEEHEHEAEHEDEDGEGDGQAGSDGEGKGDDDDDDGGDGEAGGAGGGGANGPNGAVNALVDAVREVAKGLEAYEKAELKAGWQPKLDKEIIKTSRARAEAYRRRQAVRRKAHKAPGRQGARARERLEGVEEAYQEARRVATLAAKRVRLKAWRERISEGVKKFADDPAGFWRWLKASSNNGPVRSAGGVQPLQNLDTGELEAGVKELAAGWLEHYRRLAEFPDAVCAEARLDFATWEDRSDGTIPRRAESLPGLEQEIAWSEVLEMLKSTKNRKAPGPDDIPAEVWKLATKVVDDEGEVHEQGVAEGAQPETAFAKALLRVVRMVWRTGSIPQAWESATVVSIFKKGDVTERGNYRGISLIATGLKLLSAIIAKRLSAAFEAHQVFCCEQGGFRGREEAVAQALALIEVALRRQTGGEDPEPEGPQETYALFFDLKKAFDTVPHGAMFYKLDQAGVRGRCLRFIKALYRSSSIHVRDGAGKPTASVRLKRGVRQGCPLSPVLFLLFMNDIFDGSFQEPHRPVRTAMRELGVRVPGHDRVDNQAPPPDRLVGLMFADDVVVLTESVANLVRMKRHMVEWAKRWGMVWGVPKCGIMLLTSAMAAGAARKAHLEHEFLGTAAGMIGGAQLPIVDRYEYLGLMVTETLDWQAMANGRLHKGIKVFEAMKPALRSAAIPLAARVALVKAIMLPTVLYGAEFWATSQTRVRMIWDLQKRAMRVLLLHSEHSTMIGLQAAYRELGMAPVYADCGARAVRLWVKAFALRTWIGKLVRDERWRRHPTGQSTWTNRTFMWVSRLRGFGRRQQVDVGRLAEGEVIPHKKHVKALVTRHNAARASPEQWKVFAEEWVRKSKGASRCVRELAWLRVECRGAARSSWTRYKAASFDKTRLSKLSTMWPRPVLGKGMTAVVLARMKALRTGARMRFEEGFDLDGMCQFCGAGVRDDIAHLLLDCNEWELQRGEHLGNHIDAAQVEMAQCQGMDAARRREGVSILLLGGQWGGRSLKDWEDRLPARGDDGAQHEPQAGRVADVASFLLEVLRARASEGREEWDQFPRFHAR